MATTRAAWRALVRNELDDNGVTKLWADALLNEWLNEGIRDYGRAFPLEATATLTTVAGQAAYALPADLVEVVRVEHPTNVFRVNQPRVGGDWRVSGDPWLVTGHCSLGTGRYAYDVWGATLELEPAPTTRVCMQRLLGQPEQNSGDDPEGAVAVGALVVASRQTAELLAAIDQPLHPVPQAVRRAIERPAAALRAPMRDGVPDAPAPTVRSVPAPGVTLVAHDAVGPQPRPAAPWAAHGPLFQELLEHRRLVLLARGQHQGQ